MVFAGQGRRTRNPADSAGCLSATARCPGRLGGHDARAPAQPPPLHLPLPDGRSKGETNPNGGRGCSQGGETAQSRRKNGVPQVNRFTLFVFSPRFVV